MNARHVLFASCALVAPAAVLGAACVIADPAPEVPVPPPHRPTILHGSVVPPDTAILSQFPLSFEVPVELVDPSQAFEYNVFVDDVFKFHGSVEPDPTLTDAGIRVIPVTLSPPDPAFCHVIEFIVALHFEGADPHSPDSTGGDSVAWFYNPSGNPGGCPLYDAGGLDGAFPPDGAADAGPSDAAGEASQ
jgi:hypothetical protein